MKLARAIHRCSRGSPLQLHSPSVTHPRPMDASGGRSTAVTTPQLMAPTNFKGGRAEDGNAASVNYSGGPRRQFTRSASKPAKGRLPSNVMPLTAAIGRQGSCSVAIAEATRRGSRGRCAEDVLGSLPPRRPSTFSGAFGQASRRQRQDTRLKL